jgi:hypothetical protein
MWPRGHRIFALSSGPSVDVTVYRYPTAAGSPHRAAPPPSMYAGHSRNITIALISNPPLPVMSFAHADSENRPRLLIHPDMRRPGLNQAGGRLVYQGGTCWGGPARSLPRLNPAAGCGGEPGSRPGMPWPRDRWLEEGNHCPF